MATVTFFTPSDDEAIATGGTMASLADQGHRVVLVTATGASSGRSLTSAAPDETLAERRAVELADAARILGAQRQCSWATRIRAWRRGERLAAGCFATTDVDEAAAGWPIC